MPMLTGPIITESELNVLLDDDSIDAVVCDVRAYLDGRRGRDAYDVEHIPGARFIDLDAVLAAPAAPITGRHPMPTPEVFAAGMAEAGISHTTTVVAYDDAGGMIAGRLVWMLRVLGQPAALLDGGIEAWSGDLVADTSPPVRVEHSPRPWPADATVDADEVAALINNGGLVVDSRGAARYRGETEPIDPRAGHIPGAINLPFADNLVDGRFRSRAELQQRFRETNVDANTVFYCGSGVSACHNLLAAEASGFGLGKLYVGSWSGWSSDDERPVASDLG